MNQLNNKNFVRAAMAVQLFALALSLTVMGFSGWVIYKLLQHFGVIS